MTKPTTPPLIFRQFGGSDHLFVDGADALRRLQELDPARWAVTSLPLADLDLDPELARLPDPKDTGRLRVDQLLAARDTLFADLRDSSNLNSGTDSISLDAIDPATPGGQALRRTAQRILQETRANQTTTIDLTRLRSYKAS